MIAIAGIVIAFILVIYLLSQKKTLFVAMLVGSLVVGLTSSNDINQNLHNFFPTLYKGLIDPISLEVIAVVTLVSIFAYLMKETGLLNELIEVTKHYIDNLYITIFIIPSIIGMLPITGGAIFSAPIIFPIGKKLKMNGAQMAAINIYFRHLWYFSFPFLPSLILASSLSNINIYTIALMQLPIVIVMVVSGWFYYTKTTNSKQNILDKKQNIIEENEKTKDDISWKKILKVILPFIIVIVPPIVLPIEFIITLLLGITFVIIVKKDKFHLQMIKEGFNTNLIFAVVGIMIFRTFVEKSEGVYNITNIFVEAGIPLLVLAIIIPLLVGLLTGNNSAAIGIVYPVLLVLFSSSDIYRIWHMIIFSSSYFGYILSPFHLCNLLTIEYYETTLTKYYKAMAVPIISSAIGVSVISIIYYYIF